MKNCLRVIKKHTQNKLTSYKCGYIVQKSPILPFEMKWKPVYLRVNYSSMYKFVLSFRVSLHVNLAAFP